MARASVISTQDYLDLLAQTITRHLRTLGRFQQTVTDSSFDAWTKYYKQDENTLNSVVSYYVKGSLIALCIDLKMPYIYRPVYAQAHLLMANHHVSIINWSNFGVLNHHNPNLPPSLGINID